MTKRKLATGILTWDAEERRSNRYGSIHLDVKPYAGPVATEVRYDRGAIVDLIGRRVRLTCVVLDARQSGHAGDRSLGIFPTQPSIGEVVDLGIGIFGTEHGYDGEPNLVLRPGEPRHFFWIDPRKLYRLHDQTVDVFAEETDEPFSKCADLRAETESVAYGNGDGTLQVKNVAADEMFRVPPRVDVLDQEEDGATFLVTPYLDEGERRKVEKKPRSST